MTSPLNTALAAKKKPLRWSEGKSEMIGAPKTYRLKRGGLTFAIVQHVSRDIWFWYAVGVNTCNRPLPFEDAKEQAMTFVRSHADLKPIARD